MKYIWFILIFNSLITNIINAQTDDVYYYPDDISHKSEFDYIYRPLRSFSFFDQYYIDMAYYNPFMRSATNILIYDDFYSQRIFSRFNCWNIDQFSMNSFGWFGSPVFMSFYNFSQNNNNNQVESVNPSNRYYGPRRGGSIGIVPGMRNPKIVTIENLPTERNVNIEKSIRIPSTSSRGFESPSSSQSWSMPRNSGSSSLLSNNNTLSDSKRSTSTRGRVIN